MFPSHDKSLYPEAGVINSANPNVSGFDRYTKAGLVEGGVWQYPIENDDFNVPFIQFKFLDAFGNIIPVDAAPVIYIRMPNQFNISSFSDYARTDNIFGAGNQFIKTENNAAYGKASQQEGFDVNLLAKYRLTASEAFQTSIARSLGNIEGFLQSGGLNNIAQYEFTQRQAINSFSQLL